MTASEPATGPGVGHAEEAQPGIAPLTGTEHRLAAIWQDVLEIDEVRSDSNLFEFGGNSMDAFKVANLIKETFDVYIPMKSIMTLRTLGSVAAAVDAEMAAASLPTPDGAVVTDW